MDSYLLGWCLFFVHGNNVEEEREILGRIRKFKTLAPISRVDWHTHNVLIGHRPHTWSFPLHKNRAGLASVFFLCQYLVTFCLAVPTADNGLLWGITLQISVPPTPPLIVIIITVNIHSIHPSPCPALLRDNLLAMVGRRVGANMELRFQKIPHSNCSIYNHHRGCCWWWPLHCSPQLGVDVTVFCVCPPHRMKY